MGQVEDIRLTYVAVRIWDDWVALLQVIEHRAGSVELRGLLSAPNASAAWDLLCNAREAMMSFLREEMPEAMVKEHIGLDVLADCDKRKG